MKLETLIAALPASEGRNESGRHILAPDDDGRWKRVAIGSLHYRSQDVVPERGLVTLKALVDTGVRLTSNTRRNHLEVHHVVTRRRLMALRAILGGGRRMLELSNRPAIRRVALSAILTEQLEMAVVVRVASRAVQRRFFNADVFVRRVASMGPGSQQCSGGLVFGVRGVLVKLSHANLYQCLVIHVGRPHAQAPVLQVALGATADTRMERRGLSLQQGFVICMTGNALGGCHTGDRRVAGRAIVLQMGVGG